MLGILCGLESEAKVARLYGNLVACSGAIESLARERAENLVKQGATALLSFGLAGGLSPDLKPGKLVLGTHVIDKHGNSWRCDEKLLALLTRALGLPIKGGVYGSDVLLPGPVEKKPVYQRTKCIIVDMESQVVAAVATRHKLRFGILRGISDTVDETFPDAALKGVNADGSINFGGTFASLLKNPLQLPALLKIFGNTDLVLKNLRLAAPNIIDHLAQI